jgi:hypothetical protein
MYSTIAALMTSETETPIALESALTVLACSTDIRKLILFIAIVPILVAGLVVCRVFLKEVVPLRRNKASIVGVNSQISSPCFLNHGHCGVLFALWLFDLW